jgi:hypothetical protein
MMECGTILQRLSAYLEGIVSSEEKKLIEEHLLSCQPCSSVLRELKRASELVRDLQEVEPPPWMTQKVLARIRREQEGKKGIFEKLFFPLRIKIPIQATATVLIVVLAIYVFKAGEPELKKVQSPRVSDEVASKVEDFRQPAAPTAEAPAREAKPVLKEMPKLSDRRDVSPPVGEKNKEEMAGRAREPVRDKPVHEKAKGAPEGESRVGGERQEGAGGKPDETVMTLGSAERDAAKEKRMPAAGVVKTEEYGAVRDSLANEQKAPAAAAPFRAAVAKRAEAASISVQARDVKKAADEIEDLLRQLGATRVEKESLQDTEVITAELQSEKIEEFMEKLRFKGEIKEKELPSPIPTGKTSIRVEILSVH